ncbi:MAG: tetratricopeptide repeat protein [Acidobacteriota bacterium]|nr:tetratricopeptide repeat protein [Acidobacteriota bacterium]
MAKGMYNEAIALSQKALQTDPTSQRFFYVLGYAYAKAGRKREAVEVINRLKNISKEQYAISSLIARIFAALDERDEAFSLLEKAFEEREYSLLRLKVDPGFDSLRDDLRFQDLRRRMRLPQ